MECRGLLMLNENELRKGTRLSW